MSDKSTKLWEKRSDRERRDLLNELLSNPRVRGRTVEYDLKKPFAVLAEMATNQSWRGLRDDLRNFLLSDRIYSVTAVAAKFEELCKHTSLSEFSCDAKTRPEFELCPDAVGRNPL